MIALMESSLPQLGPDAAYAALLWQIELGADEAILDTPVDRTALEAERPRKRPEAQPAAPAPVAKVSPVDEARALAQGAGDLDALREALAGFAGSDLRDAAQNCVFSDGHPSARLMIIGEAPGREEDRTGRPFVGRAGQLLDRMLGAIGHDRLSDQAASAVYIANVLPWRPPQNRTPTSQEIELFLPFLRRHIELIAPDVLMAVGNTPCQALLGRSGITRLRGNWERFDERPLMPSFHPAYLLRNPAAKREAWADLLAVKNRLRSAAP